MEWILELVLQPSMIQTVLLISVVSAIGLQLGKIKVYNISLGITFVFFVGIALGNFKLDINRDMLYFAQNFGLVLFIYSLGLQVGPGFFSSLKSGGITLNLLSLSVVVSGIATTLIFHFTTDIPLAEMIGIMSGAVTNTPMLGAAQQTYDQIVPGDAKNISEMALACAIAYPLGVTGVILAIAFIRRRMTVEGIPVENKHKKDAGMYVGEFTVVNPTIAGKSIKNIMLLSPRRFVISRIWKNGKVLIPASDSVLELNDHVLLIASKSDIDYIKLLFGYQENIDWNKEDIDWNHIDNSHLVSRRIIVTRSKVNGVKLGSLKLRNLYGINITRVNRIGIDLIPSPGLALQIGDKLTVVGEKGAIDNVALVLGNEVKRLKNPNLIAIFTGIVLGLALGAIPFPFPGVSIPVRLGIAGGPIIVGILMGAFGPRFGFATYTTRSANMMLRQMGLVVYLACLGLDAGGNFIETILNQSGLIWIGIGACITVLPVLIVGLIAIKVFKIGYADTAGMLCGSMANPMALNYANAVIDGDEPSVSYATVYPLSMFVRLISVQLILMFLL